MARIITAGRKWLQYNSSATDGELREYLRHEFLVEGDYEVVLLRSGLWPLALLVRFFHGSFERRRARIGDRVEEAIRQLRASSLPPK